MNDSIAKDLTVCIVDDEMSIRETIAHHMSRLGYSTEAYPSAEQFLEERTEDPPDILITDLKMPGIDGMELLQKMRHISPSTAMIIITAHADKQTAIDALRLGAFDFFEKPVSLEKVKDTLERTARYQAILRERNSLKKQLSELSSREAQRWGINAMIGKTKGMQKIQENIRLLQESANTSVLITGESGSGKELVARAIHFGSSRSSGPFIAVNCSAVPGNLAESELFGHVKGAFTGATNNRKGCFEQADTGTLFLDEIGDMPTEMQTKLLRVLEDNTVTPVGGNTSKKVNVRIIAATNAQLEEKIENKIFREDLFYRLAAYTINLPPLRERKDDIPLLAEYFVDAISSEMGRAASDISEEAVAALKAHPFPGNVREIKNIIEHALIESRGDPITPAHLHFTNVSQSMSTRIKTAPPKQAVEKTSEAVDVSTLDLKELETIAVKKAMQQTGGNVSAAARLLGINRTKLHRMLHRI